MPTDPAIVILPGVRLSYPHLFKAHQMKGSLREPSFQANFILDNVKHAALIKKVETVIERVALDFFKKKVPLKHKALHDGNDRPDDEGYGDGVMYVVSNSARRPAVVDSDRVTPLSEESGKIYAGCYVNASVRFFAWEHPTGGRGVSADLRAVSFLRDGESFGAGPVNPEDEFADLPEEDEPASGGRGAGRKAGTNVEDY
jgi:hypothetical protein